MATQPLARLVQTFRDTLAADAESDDALLARLRAGRDPAAAEAIVRRHGPKVLAACRKVLGPAPEAEDAFQATFLVLLRNPAAVRRSASLGAWLYGIAHRISLQARARRARRVDPLADLPAPPELPWSEACAVLHEELDRLPDAVRLPLVLCYLDGLSRDEAAQQLGRSLNSVKKALEKGRELLRLRLTRRGVTLSAGLLAAVAGPAEGEPTPELVSSVVQGAGRPAAVALAATVRPVRWPRRIGVGLAAGVLTVGVAFGLSGDPKGDPPTKDMPAKPAAPKDAPAGGPKGEQIAFAGRVVEPDGKPAAGAKVYVVRRGEIRGQQPTLKPLATTGVDGRFQITVDRKSLAGLSPTLVATTDGFGFGLLTANKEGTADAEVRLFIDQPIKGRILDLQGKPVPGATVRVVEISSEPAADLSAWLKRAEDPGLKMSLETIYEKLSVDVSLRRRSLPELQPATTDAEGRFTLSGVGRERLVALSVTGRGAAASEVMVVTQPGRTGRIKLVVPSDPPVITRFFYRQPFDHVVTPDQPLEGRVTDLETGEPIAGVTVDTMRSEFGRIEAVTDKDGQYRFAGLPPGVHFFEFQPGPDTPYHLRATFGGETDNTRPIRMDVKLRRAPWVRGKVVDERSGKPIAGAWVRYYPDRNNPQAKDYLPDGRVVDVMATTGADGSFRLPGIPGRGWLNVGVEGGGYVPAVERPLQGDTTEHEVPDRIPTTMIGLSTGGHALAALDIDPKAPKDYTITLDGGGTVPISIRDPEGKPVTGALVLGFESAWPQWSRPLAGDTVEIRGFNPTHPRTILLFHPGRQLGLVQEPKPGDAGPWTVKLRPTATVTGKLVLPDGKPYPNVSLGLSFKYPGWTGPAWPPRDLPEARTKTDAEGRFTFTKIIGDVEYDFWYPVFQDKANTTTTIQFTAKPGETKNLGTIKTDPPRR